jgi:hypothetical protein
MIAKILYPTAIVALIVVMVADSQKPATITFL